MYLRRGIPILALSLTLASCIHVYTEPKAAPTPAPAANAAATPDKKDPFKPWDDVLKVNLTANWRLIRTLDPLLRMSDAGRAIFVSSGAASRPRA